MDTGDTDSRATPPRWTQPKQIISALVVNRSPSGTMRASNEHVLIQRTSSGSLQPYRDYDVLVGEDRGVEFVVTDSLSEQEHNSHDIPGTTNATNYERYDENREVLHNIFNDIQESRSPINPEYDEILPPSLAEALAVDSGSESDDFEEDYTEIEIQQILEASENDQEPEADVTVETNDITWSNNFESFTGTEEIFTQQVGPLIDSTDPFELFCAIWDCSVMEKIVEETNEYAWQTIVKATGSVSGIPPKSRLHDWYPVTIPEMYTFFSVLIYMGICVRGRLEEYWTTGVLGMPEFRKIMSKNRFLIILRFLHFVNNYDMAINLRGYDHKLAKIKPILDHCCQKFQEIYKPRRHLSLDESLLLWKGRLSWIQCIRSKAARFGIKSYELCEGETGYLLSFLIYTGKHTSTEPIHGFTTATAKIVLTLVQDYLEKGYCIVMDNFYNSVPLARFLKQKRTDLLGTLNRRRVDTPPDVKNLLEKSMQRGNIVARHCGDVAVLAWKDVKLVTMISTYHNADTAPGQRAGISCDKPVVVHSYNKYMGGVDLKDQKLSMYLLERKRGIKWYVKLFRRLLNCSILNTYIIHQANSQSGRDKMNHRQFRFALAERLSKQNHSIQRIRPTTVATDDEVRFDGFDHHPDHVLITDRGNNNGRTRYKRGRCARCRTIKLRTEGNIICAKCKVYLCVGECWRVYHTK